MRVIREGACLPRSLGSHATASQARLGVERLGSQATASQLASAERLGSHGHVKIRPLADGRI